MYRPVLILLSTLQGNVRTVYLHAVVVLFPAVWNETSRKYGRMLSDLASLEVELAASVLGADTDRSDSSAGCVHKRPRLSSRRRFAR